jgi:hypothetical protein
MVIRQARPLEEISGVFLVNWEMAKSSFDVQNIYGAGVALNQYFNGLADAYEYVQNQNFYDRTTWRRSRRFTETLRVADNGHPIAKLIADNTSNFPQISSTFVWPQNPGRSPINDYRISALAFVNLNAQLGGLGYVERFAYAPSLEQANFVQSNNRDQIYWPQNYWLINLQPGATAVSTRYNTQDEVRTSIQSQTLRANFDLARREQEAVLFNLPIKTTRKQVGFEGPSRGEALNYEKNGLNLQLMSIDFQYRWQDLIYNDQSNDLAEVNPPEWLIEYDGYEYNSAAVAMGNQ